MLNEFEEQVRQTVPDPWEGQICTMDDAYKPRPPLRYIVEGIFPESSVSIWYGPPASMKTNSLKDAAVSVACGQPWLGRKVMQCPTLWIDLDNGKRRTNERVEALGRGHNAPPATPFYFVSMPAPWLNAGKQEDIEALGRRMIALGIKFCVIDNLSQICPGADENSDQMVTIMANLRMLAELTGAAIVIIHHQRKTKENGRAGETLRGHSSIEAAVDLALRVTRDAGSNIITIESTKTRDVDVAPFACEFRYTHKPGTYELETASFVPIDIEDTTSDYAIEKQIIDLVRATPGITQTGLILETHALVECGSKHIRFIISRLERKKKIIARKGERRAKLYFVE